MESGCDLLIPDYGPFEKHQYNAKYSGGAEENKKSMTEIKLALAGKGKSLGRKPQLCTLEHIKQLKVHTKRI